MKSSRGTLLALITLGGALALLATLQYRWLGRLADADAHRMRTALEFAAGHFEADFDHDLLTRMYLAFGEPTPVGSPAALAERYQAWIAAQRDPQVIRAIDFVAAGSSNLQRLDVAHRRFVSIPWPPALESVRQHVATQDRSMLERVPAVVPEAPALVVPCGAVILQHEQFAEMLRRHLTMACPSFTIIELDRTRLLQGVLPGLTRRYFGAANGGDYEVAIADRQSGAVMYRSDRWPSGGDLHADFEMPIFQLRLPQFADGEIPRMQPSGPWRLLVRYRGGSLAEMVAAAHLRNLAVALAVLVVLGGSAATLMFMLRRAQRLQQQQLQFVAGITHELNTPLAAMTAAGQNLADGIISDHPEVTRYGKIILKESRRLTDMLAQVLDYAGIESKRKPLRPDDVDVASVVRDAVEECRWMTENKPVRVDVDVASALASVRGDAAALTRAVQNLVANAIRHGGDGVSVRVTARSEGDGVAILVEDDGLGIAAADLPHLFEPFFRGRGADGVRGSGLGLTIVQQIVAAHGGEVIVDENRRRGAAFTIALPAISAAAPMQQVAGEHA